LKDHLDNNKQSLLERVIKSNSKINKEELKLFVNNLSEHLKGCDIGELYNHSTHIIKEFETTVDTIKT